MQPEIGSCAKRSVFEADPAFKTSRGRVNTAAPSSDDTRPHPIYAPLAWLACLLAGALFWSAVLYLVI